MAYAVVLRWLPTRLLAAFAGVMACGAAAWLFLGPTGDLLRGWMLTPEHVGVALLRLFLSFGLGFLLARVARPCPVRVPFWALAAALLFAHLAARYYDVPFRCFLSARFARPARDCARLK